MDLFHVHYGMPFGSTAKGTGGAVWPRVLDAPAADTQKSSLSKCSLGGSCYLLGPSCLVLPTPRRPDSTNPSHTCHSRWVPWKTWHLPPSTQSRQAAQMGKLICFVKCRFLGLSSLLIQTLGGGPRNLHFDPRWFGFTLKLARPGLGFPRSQLPPVPSPRGPGACKPSGRKPHVAGRWAGESVRPSWLGWRLKCAQT